MHEGLSTTRLSEVADLEMGQSPPSRFVTDRPFGVPFLQGNAEFGRTTPNSESYCTEPKKLCRGGDVLISVRAPVGDLNKADQTYCIGRGLAAIRFTEIDPDYGWYGLHQWARDLDRVAQGTTFRAVGKSQLQNLRLTILPLPEQRRIAEILDTVDRAIRHTEAIIAKLEQVKAGLLHDLLTRGLDENGELRDPERHPEQFKDSPLGRIPWEWEVVPVGDVFSLQLGKMLSKAAKTGQSPAPYLGNKNVQWDRVDLSELEWMDFDPEERVKYSLQPGDLLVCEGGEVGRTAIWRGETDDCYFQKAIHRLRPRQPARVRPEFMLRYMRFAARNDRFDHLTGQTSIAHLTKEKLQVLQLPVPPLPEQGRIISVSQALDAASMAERSQRKKMTDLKTGLMQDLLTGRVRVPFGDPAPANA